MKRTLALTLAAIMLAASLAGCADAPRSAAISPRITLTSSDAESAADWLTARLGAIPDRIVIGTSADGYGVDVSALEDDGYFIRALGDKVALLAETPDGLDRAVRKYAKTVEQGEAVGDVTYHEGARVKRIEIAGRDIAEYAIFCENDSYMLAAANELAARIAEACGASLPVVTGEPAAPYIALRWSHDEALRYVGHRWGVTDDGVVIECSDRYKGTSASYAVCRFLQKNLGWMGLIYGIEDLPAADLVTIDAGTEFEETAEFDWAVPASGTTMKYDEFSNTSADYGPYMRCCHGMQNSRFAGELSASADHNWATDQPCWLDDTFYEVARDDIVAYIESRLASGAVIGDNFVFIDVSHGDNSNWCKCKKCNKLYIAEGGTHAAEVLTWINALSDELDEIYPGIMYGVFAYEMTKRPPKTIKPNEHVSISFCYDRSCSSHPLDGSKCTSLDQWEWGQSNPELTEWLLRWLDICNYVTLWYYSMANGLLSMSFFQTVREDMKFFRDAGVKQLFGCADDHGFSANWIVFCLVSELYWNVDMSDEEYDALCDRLFAAFYGDAAPEMREYFEVIGRIHEYGSCYTCWGALMGAETPYYTAVDADRFAANYDSLFELIERATALADSALEEERMVMIGCALIYKGSLCAYPEAQAAGDTARMDELCARYDLLDLRLMRYGMEGVFSHKPTLKAIFPD